MPAISPRRRLPRQPDRHPVVGVSWRDAQPAGWLRGKPARPGGNDAAGSFGQTITAGRANYGANYTYAGGLAGRVSAANGASVFTLLLRSPGRSIRLFSVPQARPMTASAPQRLQLAAAGLAGRDPVAARDFLDPGVPVPPPGALVSLGAGAPVLGIVRRFNWSSSSTCLLLAD